MAPRIAVAYYPEGKGHATRMLAVAQALETRGAEIRLAGGGPGDTFVAAFGYDQYQPTEVDFIDDHQRGSLLALLGNSVPRSAARVIDHVRWLRRTAPDALVTDDMFAALAAPLVDVPLYVCTHNAAALYDAVIEQVFTGLLNRYQTTVARAFFYPTVWPACSADPAFATRVPPVALEAPADAPRPATEGGVLLVPSAYSEGFTTLAEHLRDAGHRVTQVGDEDWEPVPSLLPWVRAAAVVVCSGYSTVMEAAVAGTPCVVYPFTDEQHGVSRRIERLGVRGFQVEHSPRHVVRAVESPPARPRHENGAADVARAVLADLSEAHD